VLDRHAEAPDSIGQVPGNCALANGHVAWRRSRWRAVWVGRWKLVGKGCVCCGSLILLPQINGIVAAVSLTTISHTHTHTLTHTHTHTTHSSLSSPSQYWEEKGVPIRVEIGRTELANGTVIVADLVKKTRHSGGRMIATRSAVTLDNLVRTPVTPIILLRTTSSTMAVVIEVVVVVVVGLDVIMPMLICAYLCLYW
jgi:hypothetical protein